VVIAARIAILIVDPVGCATVHAGAAGRHRAALLGGARRQPQTDGDEHVHELGNVGTEPKHRLVRGIDYEQLEGQPNPRTPWRDRSPTTLNGLAI
jgi:hypothetical protein